MNGYGGYGNAFLEITPSECAHKCNIDPKCKSFVYSEIENRCKLQNRPLPPEKGKTLNGFRDFTWCSKSKNNEWNKFK